jgi:hypothetical protein
VSANALGSGRLTPDRVGDFDNPYPLETALFRLDRDDLVAEVTVAFFQTARAYQEGFSVYGRDRGLEWPGAVNEDELLLFELQPVVPGRRGRPATVRVVRPPDRGDLLPPAIAPFTLGSAHSGSHPHLVHEWVRSLVEGRPAVVDAVTAASWPAPGIAGHESAMRGGDPVGVPDFGTPTGFGYQD